MFCVFFFKQTTAYEMRISDWSSDVCSSDLSASPLPCPKRSRSGLRQPCRRPGGRDASLWIGCVTSADRPPSCLMLFAPVPTRRWPRLSPGTNRSEEHTFELQSLMRTSYAVFCLKKKNQLNNAHSHKLTFIQQTS